jgi:flagellar basal-body rod modification protein FlgD
MTSVTTTTDLANQASQTAQQRLSLGEDFSQFLTLLTTQLQNQDPLSPMDSTEFTNQLVQFSQVEQQINANQKLDSLLQLQLASISSVALGYVGMDVSYLSAEMNYDGTNDITINYALGESAQVAKMNVYDEEGELVYSVEAPKSVGRNEIVWDGRTNSGEQAEPGTYTVSIDAATPEGTPIDTSTIVSGRVHGIESQNGVIYLLIGERAVSLANIVNAKVPAESVIGPGDGTDTTDGAGGADDTADTGDGGDGEADGGTDV